jgi:hypothetical protein
LDLAANITTLKTALEKIKLVAVKINEEVKSFENGHRILEIQNSFLFVQKPLVQLGRKFVREGKICEISDNFVSDRHLFLFSDILVRILHSSILIKNLVDRISHYLQNIPMERMCPS